MIDTICNIIDNDQNPVDREDKPWIEEKFMNLETGLVIVVIATGLFYLRVLLLQRGKARRAREFPLRQKGGGKQQAPVPETGIQVSSWLLVAISIILILAGFILRTSGVTIKDYWWIITSVGILVLAFSIH